MTVRLNLVCHAATGATRAAAFPGDDPLDAPGLRKLSAVAAPLRGQGWTSPALAARATAAVLSPAAAIEPALRDWDHGRWRGRSLDEVEASEPEAVRAWLRDAGAAPHGGETLLDVLDRTVKWLAVQKEATGAVVAITHAAVIRAAIVSAVEAAPQTFWRIDIAPLSLVTLSCSHGRWSLGTIGPLPIGARPGPAP